jgi:chromosome segregation ATPase
MIPKKRKKFSDDLVNSLMDDLKNNVESNDATALLIPEIEKESPINISNDEKTVNIASLPSPSLVQSEPPQEKISFGVAKPSARSGVPISHSFTDAQLQQADSLKLAQKRILDLESHLERLRSDNEQLSGVTEIAKSREEELLMRIQNLEKSRAELREQGSQDLSILRDNLQNKEFEGARLKMRVEELEGRLQADLRKIRVRERELENRLELTKMEKTTLLKAKDDNILDLKRKLDQMHTELEMYKQKCLELNQKIEANNDQFSRTVRALRLALTNLEANDATMSSLTLTALKKAE